MPSLTFRSSLDAPADAVFNWHARPGAFQRLTPPWAPVRLESLEGIRDGDRAVIRLGPGKLSLKWVAEHFGYEEGRQFCDAQVEGPFRSWEHTHRMTPDGPERCTLIDHIDYELPLGDIGSALNEHFGAPELKRQFAYRHRITARDLALHRRYNPEGRALSIAVSGTSGLVGTQLVAFLRSGGHTVHPLVRHAPAGPGEILWDPAAGAVEAEKLNGVDAVIHLAGENVFALRWTEDKKRRIYNSRAQGTRLLAEAIAGCDDPPRVLLSSSAIGYYGDHGAEPITEETPPRDAGFLGEVCAAWEAATQPAADAGVRTAQLRTGVVLSPAGGALQLMLPAFQIGLGGRIGPRDMYFSWITLDDVIGGFYHALMRETVHGPVNLTAPQPVRMQTYAETLAGVLGRPALLNVPAFAVRAAFGEMADEFLLQSARVLPEKLETTGYDFGYAGLRDALQHVLGRTLRPHAPASAAA
ncbi:TIGR01777 family oxidoreductase [Salisaeta longa]|uniref:TIGR01777 family oxidoreductase n=1 Tax=Salisaeta longa TaxID=503170 RepID=UPI0003B76EAD|nr:TIGR01777 family oxidoreductase [Salisaeta longa]